MGAPFQEVLPLGFSPRPQLSYRGSAIRWQLRMATLREVGMAQNIVAVLALPLLVLPD
jgi:hypothetical protein